MVGCAAGVSLGPPEWGLCAILATSGISAGILNGITAIRANHDHDQLDQLFRECNEYKDGIAKMIDKLSETYDSDCVLN